MHYAQMTEEHFSKQSAYWRNKAGKLVQSLVEYSFTCNSIATL